MGILGWIFWIIVGLVVVCTVIKITTKNNYDEDDDFENRIGLVSRLWGICCRTKKRRYGI